MPVLFDDVRMCLNYFWLAYVILSFLCMKMPHDITYVCTRTGSTPEYMLQRNYNM